MAKRRHSQSGEIDKLTVLPLPLVTNETIKYCQEGTWQEMADGCNAFPPSLVSNPGWFASIYSPETPEVGLQAALVFLSADATSTEEWMKRASHALPRGVPVGISTEGAEGPGAYGLNRNVAMTVIVTPWPIIHHFSV